jgi:hypothetical protein
MIETGNNLRNLLVQLHNDRNIREYDLITQKIIFKYRKENDKGFFIHLDRQIKTFRKHTLIALERSLTQLQENGIPESMPHLHYILETSK